MSHWVVGYPDAVFSADSARIWEEQQIEVKELPRMRQLNEEEKTGAFAAASLAVSCFDHTLDWLATLIDRIEGTAERDKVAGIYDQLSDYRLEVNKMKEGWG